MSHPVNLYSTLWELPSLDFPHSLLGQRDSRDPDLEEHLRGFVGFVTQGGTRPMSATLYHVIQHIQRVQNHLSVQVEAEHLDAMSDWAQRANALIFLPDASVRDPQGRVLISAKDGASDPAAQVPYPPDAHARKQRSVAALQAKGVRTPPGLPPVLGAGELALRDPEELVGRTLALMAVAVYAEGLHSGQRIPASEIQARLNGAQLSDTEQAFLHQEQPPEQEIVNYAWRYEGLAVLLWTLGHLPELPTPDQIADVPTLARTVFELGEEGLMAKAAVREGAAVLDTLDLHLRMHWAAREANRKGEQTPAGLHAGVLMERHKALNWITCWQDADWDQVDTPT